MIENSPKIKTIELNSNISKGSGKGEGMGENGATFIPIPTTPEINKLVLNWINDKGLVNPKEVSIVAPQGVQGLKGDKGDKGDQGERGLQGLQGLQGEQGIQGEKGDKGDKGDKGEAGDIGNIDLSTYAKKTELTTLETSLNNKIDEKASIVLLNSKTTELGVEIEAERTDRINAIELLASKNELKQTEDDILIVLDNKQVYLENLISESIQQSIFASWEGLY